MGIMAEKGPQEILFYIKEMRTLAKMVRIKKWSELFRSLEINERITATHGMFI